MSVKITLDHQEEREPLRAKDLDHWDLFIVPGLYEVGVVDKVRGSGGCYRHWMPSCTIDGVRCPGGAGEKLTHVRGDSVVERITEIAYTTEKYK